MSAEKTLAILDLFDFETRSLTVSEIAEKLNQPQSSVYRHLRVLKEKDYMLEVQDGQYRLGYKFLKMAKIVRSDNSLMIVARPEMEKLMEETTETIILSVRSNYHAVCLDTIPSLHPIKVSSEQGGIMPLHCGASSKVLLAAMNEKFIDTLFEKGLVQKFQPNTLSEKGELIENLEWIRQNGYAFSDGEIDEGVVTYGTPIHDFNGKIIASLSIAGPRERMLQQDKFFFIEKIKEAAKKIEQYL
ncbi:IclR family transcriptional regulator [Bacillus sp. 03113]|uniref:IclR family transcriptional regulator n=1 Tax=Bacillus sp. 03113 TaxID=2578211 RepID=UPI0011436D3C|nr:IclR family transcriptional regulator [Bacillus sp. 03113]